MKEKQDKVTKAFQDSIFDSSLTFVADTGDAIIDIASNVHIPILGLIFDLCKGVISLSQYFVAKNYKRFILSVEAGTIDPEKKEAYIKKLNDDPKFAQKELGKILQLVGKTTDEIKVVIMANLYRNYIEDKISALDFYDLLEDADRIFLTDHEVLIAAYKNGGVGVNEFANYKYDRLIALGLLLDFNRNGSFIVNKINDSGELIETREDVKITSLGKLYCKYGLEVEEK